MDDTIEDIVRSYVPFVYGESSKGWLSVYCEVCGDGTHSKGTRGGWLFDNEICFYNCFNCVITGNFDPNRDIAHSKDMWKIFRAFNIPENEVSSIVMSKMTEEKKKLKRKERVHLPVIAIPDYFKLLADFDEDDLFADEARDFIWSHYKMKDTDYPLFLSTGETKADNMEEVYLAKFLRNRIIIPAFNNGKMMYWQARIFIGESKSKYISATVEDSNAVMFGLDNMRDRNASERPLYVTEGFFDSWHVNGVANITNTLKPPKIKLLNQNHRRKVVIPDYNTDGMHLADQAIELEWGIALPDILPYTDICSAINHFGKLYVLRSIVANTYYGFEAKLRLREFKLQNL